MDPLLNFSSSMLRCSKTTSGNPYLKEGSNHRMRARSSSHGQIVGSPRKCHGRPGHQTVEKPTPPDLLTTPCVSNNVSTAAPPRSTLTSATAPSLRVTGRVRGTTWTSAQPCIRFRELGLWGSAPGMWDKGGQDSVQRAPADCVMDLACPRETTRLLGWLGVCKRR